jgi:hypothetical protein
MDTLLCNTDNLIFVSGVRNVLTGAYLTSGVVSLTGLYDEAGEPVAGQDWPAPMAYLPNPPADIDLPDLQGVWYAIVDEEADIKDGRVYTAVIDAAAEGDLRRRWRLRLLGRDPVE